MFKVLLVEDEHIVRMALKSLIDWRTHGIEIIGECINGAEALRVLKDEAVDIVITDINMPVMNGIELIKQLKELEIDASVIVLSAYNDYAFVREAFKLGVKDYILKSEMEPGAILEMVKKTLSNRISHSFKIIQANDHQRKNVYLLLKSIAEGVDPFEKSTIDQLQHELGYKGNFDCCALLIDDFTQVKERYGDKDLGVFSKHVIEHINFQLNKERSAKVVCMSASNYMILHWGMCASEAASHTKLEQVLKSVQKSLKVYLDITVSVGVVSNGKNLNKLSELYKEALSLANLRYLYGKGSIIYQKNANFIKQIDSESISGQETDLLEAIKSLDPNRIDTELDVILNRIASFRSKSVDQLILFYFELVLLINIKCKEMSPLLQHITDQNSDYYAIIKQYGTKEEIHRWIKGYVHRIHEILSKEVVQTESHQVKKAKKFIAQNYAKNIGLTDIAEVVELSESYLSKLFVSETGETFIHYLTRFRITKACDLLEKSNMKVYEVAKEIGYDNVEHFSRVFKKTMGLSPLEYKKHS